MVKNCRFGLLLTALFVIGLSVFSAHAQTPSITLTVGLYHASGNSALRSRLDQFQAAHPGITVTAVDLPALQNELITNPAKHMDDIAHFASSADVLQIVPDLINEADSRAGYFLNIKPLVDQDNTIQASDYYPAAWQSWLWDNAQWGLPVTAEPIVMLYDPVTFDSAGIAYPSANWTADDLAKAIRALSIKNTNGTLSQSAIDLTLPTVLYASLIGSPLFDVNAVPSSPDLAQPGVIPFLTAWQSIHRDGLLDGHDATASPMQITDFHEVIRAAQNNRKLAVALPPLNA